MPARAKPVDVADRLRLAGVGLEAEFSLFVDEQPVRPEEIFRDPRAFVRESLVHRVGTSYHLPTGGAVYFDSGVMELVTPIIELERGCVARAGRSLWESILFVRGELDAWEKRTGHRIRMVGFSTHYNVSVAGRPRAGPRRLDPLARLLTYLVPVPVMVLATNRRSTGVGVRPRPGRIEVTADFTPSSSRMIAAGSLIAGVARDVMTWPTWRLAALARHGVPRLVGFRPMPHTSRRGWLARFDCYHSNPFASCIDEAVWQVRRDGRVETASLRQVGFETFRYFRRAIARVADPFSLRVIRGILSGRAPSLLDLPDRPPEYEDVGRLCGWERTLPAAMLDHSRLERIVMRALSGAPLRIGDTTYAPTGLQGWSRVVFRRTSDGRHVAFPIDALLQHLEAWEQG